jgi:hypothetical protein
MVNISGSQNKTDKTVLISMISGILAGSFSKLIMHPVDTLKAIIQVDTSVVERPSIIRTLKNISQHEGALSLYRGLPIAVLGSIPGSVLYFGSYEFAKKKLLLLENFSKGEFLIYFISGMFAETISCIVYVPVDVIKERRQVQSTVKYFTYKNDLDAIKTIIKQEGIRGYYKAYGATIFSFGPMSAFYFMFYEYFKGFFVRNDAKTYIQRVKKEGIDELKNVKLDISFTQGMICSAIAGCLASLITNPLDLVKLRMQVQRGGEKYTGQKQQYRNMIHGLSVIAKTEGFQGMTKGAFTRALYHTPCVALSMGFLEFMKPIVRKLFTEEI